MAHRAIESMAKKAAAKGAASISAGAHDVNLFLRVTGVYVKQQDTKVTPTFPEASFLLEKIIAWAAMQADPATAIVAFLASSVPSGLSAELVNTVTTQATNQIATAKAAFQANAEKANRAGSTSFAGLVEKVVDE